jgi:hypothetical protein
MTQQEIWERDQRRTKLRLAREAAKAKAQQTAKLYQTPPTTV